MKVSKNSVRFEVGIWRDKTNAIHIALTDRELNKIVSNFHTTVNNRDGSERCHKNLYKKLEAVLSYGKKEYETD